MNATQPERATAAALAVVGGFQAALAAGAPWGRAAYGGAHDGPLPGRLRAVSAAASIVYCAGAALVWRDVGSEQARRRAFTALSVFMAVGTLVNGASRSPVERTLWTPLTAATAISAWCSRPKRDLAHGGGGASLGARVRPLAKLIGRHARATAGSSAALSGLMMAS